MTVAAGHERWLRAATESVWGTKDTSPTWILVPFVDYSVALTPDARTADVALGLEQVRQGQHFHGIHRIGGGLRTYAYPVLNSSTPLIETLLDWAMTRTAGALTSYTLEEYNREISNRHLRHLGMLCNSLTLSCSADSPELAVDLDLVGKDEEKITGTDPTIPDPPGDGPFVWLETDLTIDDVAVYLQSFSLAINNNVEVAHCNDRAAQHNRPGRRELSLTIAMPYDAETYTDMLRLGGDLDFAATFTHPVKATTTNAETAGSDVTVECDQVYGFYVNDEVYITDGTSEEWATVDGVSRTNKTLTLDLTESYDADATITKGKFLLDLDAAVLDTVGRRFSLNGIDMQELTFTCAKPAGQADLVYTVE